MQRSFKFISFLAVVVLLFSVILAGCGSNKDKTETTASPVAASTESTKPGAESTVPAIDTSKELNLKGYLIGEAPKGMPDVMTELNTRLKKDINATLQVDYIGNGDLAAKYPLILASGSDTDWIYSADWNNYVQHASKGGYLELTEEMIQKYMPRYYASIDKNAFKQAKVNGKIYMLPAPALSPAIPMLAIRSDLRKKYNIPEINRVSDLGPYFEAIKKNEPNMIPAAFNGTSDTILTNQMINEQGKASIQISYGIGISYFLGESTGKITSYDEEPIVSRLKTAVQTMKTWYDAGYINKDYFSNKINSKDSFDQGKSAVGIVNAVSVRGSLETAASKGFEIELIPFIDAESKVSANSYLANGVSIPAGAKNVERTLMALDLIMSEQSYNYLAYYGIEGKNYVLKDGKLGLPEGVTAATNSYPPDASGFWFTDIRQFPPNESWSDSYTQMLKKIQDDYLLTGALKGFTFDTQTIKTEIATLANVRSEYYVPLIMGSVKNVDDAFKTYVEKAKVAGIQKVKDEMQKQINEFLKQQ